MRIRLRGPDGAATVTLTDDATIGDLIQQVTEKTSITNFDVKYGYPPKPLPLDSAQTSLPLSSLSVKLDGEQLIISPKEDIHEAPQTRGSGTPSNFGTKQAGQAGSAETFHFGNTKAPSRGSAGQDSKPVSLQRKEMEGDVPEIPLPELGATLVLRVMPDDNSCLFRAFGTAVLPGDDQSMPELRSLVASAIQAEPDVYTKVVLEKAPDDYCKWIQTADAWGGAIELNILSKHFDIEICSIDVQSLRVDRFNEGSPTRCILVYSGIHYDTIVQSPSDAPHLKAHNPPDFDQRVWDSEGDGLILLTKALELCQRLQAKHYYTDTGGMAIKCNVCGAIVYGENQAAQHAQQMGHYDMAEVTT